MISFLLTFILFAPSVSDMGPAAPETFSKPGIEESLYRCQMDKLTPEGILPPEATCVCRSQHGLEETPPCRALRQPNRKSK